MEPIETTRAGLSVLNTMRRNTDLSVSGDTTFFARSCGHVQGWPDPCSPSYDPDAVKCAGPQWSEHTFRKFTFFDLDLADCLDPEMSPDATTRSLVEADSGYAIATELQSAPWSGSPSLQSTAVDLTPASGAVHPKDLWSIGLAAITGAGFGSSSVVVPPIALGALDSELRYVNGTVRGPGNLSIITGPGLTGVGPDDTGNISTPGEATVYFLTSTVEYHLSEAVDYFATNGSTTFTAHRLNRTYAETLRHGKVRFNPTCVYAVRVCLRNESCCGASPVPPAPLNEVVAEPMSAPVVEEVVIDEPVEEVVIDEPVEEVVAEPVELEILAEPMPQDEPELTPPDGTVVEVLAWVDGDPLRATAAMLVELDGKNRTTLIDQLNEIIGAA